LVTPQIKYRADIDGLRAIAVLLVLLFHADLGVPGGYIGVDVFFVISGYLMTALLLKEGGDGPPRLRDFYARRIRRIIPAASAMVIVVLAAGLVLLLPAEYIDLAKSALAQQLMLSNVYFWRNTGYFDGAAELKPLLHTWSLAVEEQFYLVYPLLLMCLRRFRRSRVGIALGLLALMSFAASLYGTWNHPSVTFYLLPTRAWELMIGGLICVIPPPRRVPAWLLHAAGSASLLAILVASMIYTENTPFPGVAALVPCIATAVLIYTNQGTLNWAGALLAWRPLVSVGLISYSLYLWHWPILAFARIRLNVGEEQLPLSVAARCLLATFALAYASWRWIESPFRRHTQGIAAWRRPVVTAVACTLLVCAACLGITASGGVSARFPESRYPWLYDPYPHRKYEMTTDDVVRHGPMRFERDTVDADDSLQFLVWGDSHAMAVAPAFEALGAELSLSGAVIAQSGTPPCFGVMQGRHGPEGNRAWCSAFESVLARQPVKGVALVARWSYYMDPDTRTTVMSPNSTGTSTEEAMTALTQGLKSTIRSLTSRGIKVVLLLEVPQQAGDPVSAYTWGMAIGQQPPTGANLTDYQQHQQSVARVISELQDEDVTIVRVERCAFDSSGISRLGDDHGPFYLDDDHVSPHGARQLLAPLLRDWMHELQRSE
jgi:peptidoglycan/LPS O-acetylase OafA/YrhL